MYQFEKSIPLIGILSIISFIFILTISIATLEWHLENKKAEKEQMQKEMQHQEFMSQIPDGLSVALENYENMIMEYLKTSDKDSSMSETDSVVYRDIIKAQFNILNIISQLNFAAEMQLKTKNEAFFYDMYSNGTIKGEKMAVHTTAGYRYRIYCTCYDPWKEAQIKLEHK